LLMRLPVVGRTIRTMALARLAWTLGLALNAGMDACRAIRLALLSTQHRYFIRHTPDVEATIVRGGQFHEALRKTRTMPDEFLQALENAEVTGTETESLRHLSQDYAQRALAAATTLGYLATLATWGMIAALLIAVFFHLFFSLYLNPINEALDMRI
jgi:type IV pilus assembly protein PilC